MGLKVPPLPLTKEEFEKQISEGKKTLQEIDPKLWKWAGFFARRKFLKAKVKERKKNE